MYELPDHIFFQQIELTPTIPLYVYLVKGQHQAGWIDSGLRDMHEALRRLMQRNDITAQDLRYILHTHSHHDHIGGTAQLVDFTGAEVVAPEAHAHWHNDWEAHYQEFARSLPDLIPDTPALKQEVLGILDAPHQVDRFCVEGDMYDLGGGVVLECVMFSGHVAAEAGWFDRSSDTLLLGDVITLLDQPFIHGHVDVQGYQESLDKLDRFVLDRGVEWICMAHYAPMDAAQLLDLSSRARGYLLDIRRTVLEQVGSAPTALEAIWRGTCQRLGKQAEFRALATIQAHLAALSAEQLIHLKDDQHWVRA